MERMFSTQNIDGTFSELGKAVGDDYNISGRAFGTTKTPFNLSTNHIL